MESVDSIIEREQYLSHISLPFETNIRELVKHF